MPSGAFNSSNRAIFPIHSQLKVNCEITSYLHWLKYSRALLALVAICTTSTTFLPCTAFRGLVVAWGGKLQFGDQTSHTRCCWFLPLTTHHTAPHCTALHNTTLHHSALHNTTPNHTGLHHTAGRHTSTHLSTLTLHSIPLTRFLTSPADPSTLHWLECPTNTQSACFNWSWLLFQRAVLVLMKTQILYCFPERHDLNLVSRTSGPLPLTWMIR